MKRVGGQEGFSHVVVVIVLVLALVFALGFVFWQNIVANNSDGNATASTKTDILVNRPDNEIIDLEGDMRVYRNNKLGFEFEFPDVVMGSVGCIASDKWRDNYGNWIDSPVEHYVLESGKADMTVVSGDNRFTIIQKQVPVIQTSTYGSDMRRYNSACSIEPVTQELIDSPNTTVAERRVWQIYKIGNESEIASKAYELSGLGVSRKGSVKYALGALSEGRREVSYSYEPDTTVGRGGSRTWYYPSSKLLVHIGLGQSNAFTLPDGSDSYYLDKIVDSFKTP